MRKTVLLLALTLLVVLLANGVAQAQATNETATATLLIEVTVEEGSYCLEEPVTLSGEELYRWHTVTDPTGGWHFKFDDTFQLTGVGEVSGDTYRFLFHFPAAVYYYQSPEDFQPDESYTGTMVESGVGTYLFISQGPSDNYFGHWTGHRTVNGKGEEITLPLVPNRDGCRG